MAGSTVSPKVKSTCDGQSLETLSDDIDSVNILKASVKNQAIFEASKFDQGKDKAQFRNYEVACEKVKEFYFEQHENQTVAFNLKARNDFKSRTRAEMTVWEAIETLNFLIDDSDPDTSLSQIEHLLQAAEAMRRDGKPRWMQLTGLIHDLGKLLYFLGSQGQWDVVGDTFPVGCAFDDRIIYSAKSFEKNPDYGHEIYGTEYGIYTHGCGLDNVMLSWGHDEYLYHVVKTQSTLPPEALAMIRYHSFYPWHTEGAYHHLMNDKDEHMLEAVRAFNPYDLYSKSDEIPDVEELKVCFLILLHVPAGTRLIPDHSRIISTSSTNIFLSGSFGGKGNMSLLMDTRQRCAAS
ncbi:putative inositol oxygenase [Microsporum canis]